MLTPVLNFNFFFPTDGNNCKNQGRPEAFSFHDTSLLCVSTQNNYFNSQFYFLFFKIQQNFLQNSSMLQHGYTTAHWNLQGCRDNVLKAHILSFHRKARSQYTLHCFFLQQRHWLGFLSSKVRTWALLEIKRTVIIKLDSSVVLICLLSYKARSFFALVSLHSTATPLHEQPTHSASGRVLPFWWDSCLSWESQSDASSAMLLSCSCVWLIHYSFRSYTKIQLK